MALPSSNDPKYTFLLADYVVPSNGWCTQNSIKNTLGDGGCIHLIWELYTNAATSTDKYVISFGRGELKSWSPGATNPSCYIVVGRNSDVIYFQCRGVGNGNQGGIALLANEDGIVDIRLYATYFKDMNTGETHEYMEAMAALMGDLATYDRISVGRAYGTALAGAPLTLFAVEY